MHLDRWKGNQKPRASSLCGWMEPSCPPRGWQEASCAACGDPSDCRFARIRWSSAESTQAYPNRHTRETMEVQGVPEFSQVFASEYRVRVEFKSPAKSCLRPVW